MPRKKQACTSVDREHALITAESILVHKAVRLHEYQLGWRVVDTGTFFLFAYALLTTLASEWFALSGKTASEILHADRATADRLLAEADIKERYALLGILLVSYLAATVYFFISERRAELHLKTVEEKCFDEKKDPVQSLLFFSKIAKAEEVIFSPFRVASWFVVTGLFGSLYYKRYQFHEPGSLASRIMQRLEAVNTILLGETERVRLYETDYTAEDREVLGQVFETINRASLKLTGKYLINNNYMYYLSKLIEAPGINPADRDEISGLRDDVLPSYRLFILQYPFAVDLLEKAMLVAGIVIAALLLKSGYSAYEKYREKILRQGKTRLLDSLFHENIFSGADETDGCSELKSEDLFALYAIQLPEKFTYQETVLTTKRLVDFLASKKWLSADYRKDTIIFCLDSLSIRTIERAKAALPVLLSEFMLEVKKETDREYGRGIGMLAVSEKKDREIKIRKVKKEKRELEEKRSSLVSEEALQLPEAAALQMLIAQDEKGCLYKYPPEEKAAWEGAPVLPLWKLHRRENDSYFFIGIDPDITARFRKAGYYDVEEIEKAAIKGTGLKKAFKIVGATEAQAKDYDFKLRPEYFSGDLLPDAYRYRLFFREKSLKVVRSEPAAGEQVSCWISDRYDRGH